MGQRYKKKTKIDTKNKKKLYLCSNKTYLYEKSLFITADIVPCIGDK